MMHGKPGTALQSVMPLCAKVWATFSKCNCNQYARQMDAWGTAECRRRRTEIAEHLLSQIPIAARSERVKDMALDLVDRAIAIAEKPPPSKPIKCQGCGRVRANSKGDGYCDWCQESEDSPSWDTSTLPPIRRHKMPAEATVITACDQAFLKGAYLLAWSLLRANDCRMRVYDLGIDRNHRITRQMQSWGIEFVTIPRGPMPDGVPNWQTWNKPAYIIDALSEFSRVAWIDADCAVAGSIAPMFLADEMFIADHGTFDPRRNRSPVVITNHFGKPKRIWHREFRQYPCAGIIGVSQKQVPLITQWQERVRECSINKKLRRACRLYDQSVLQDHVDVELQDGRVWCDFSVPRAGSPEAIITNLYQSPDRVIAHYGGPMKPWSTWSDQVDLGEIGQASKCDLQRK